VLATASNQPLRSRPSTRKERKCRRNRTRDGTRSRARPDYRQRNALEQYAFMSGFGERRAANLIVQAEFEQELMH
jgi:hypothetical protein